MENFILYEQIGTSDGTTTYKGRRKSTIAFVTIHCIEKRRRPFITNWVRLAHTLDSLSVVRFHEWYETGNHLWLVMEMCSGDSLRTVLDQDIALPESCARDFASQIARSLYYLHENQVVLVNVLPEIFVLDSNGVLKANQLSTAQHLGENLQAMLDQFSAASPETAAKLKRIQQYTAPELLAGGQPSISADLWSFGCLLYELFVGKLPFLVGMDGLNDSDAAKAVLRTEQPPLRSPIFDQVPSREFSALVSALLNKEPTSRPDWPTLLSHPFWNGRLDDLLPTEDSSSGGSVGINGDSGGKKKLDESPTSEMATQPNKTRATTAGIVKTLEETHRPKSAMGGDAEMGETEDVDGDGRVVSSTAAAAGVDAMFSLSQSRTVASGGAGLSGIERGRTVDDLRTISPNSVNKNNKKPEVTDSQATLRASAASPTGDDDHRSIATCPLLTAGIERDFRLLPVFTNNRLFVWPPTAKIDAKALSPAVTAVTSTAKLAAMSSHELDEHFHKINEAFVKCTVTRKMNLLNYLGWVFGRLSERQSGAGDVEIGGGAENGLGPLGDVNVSGVVRLLQVSVKCLRDHSSPNDMELRIRACRSVSQLAHCLNNLPLPLRKMGKIPPTFNDIAAVVTELSEVVRDSFRNVKMRQALLICLAEVTRLYMRWACFICDKPLDGTDVGEAVGTTLSSICISVIFRSIRDFDDANSNVIALCLVNNLYFMARNATSPSCPATAILDRLVGPEVVQHLWTLCNHCGTDQLFSLCLAAICQLVIEITFSGLFVQYTTSVLLDHRLFFIFLDKAAVKGLLSLCSSLAGPTVGKAGRQSHFVVMLLKVFHLGFGCHDEGQSLTPSERAQLWKLLQERDFLKTCLNSLSLDNPSIYLHIKVYLLIIEFCQLGLGQVDQTNGMAPINSVGPLLVNLFELKLVNYMEHDVRNKLQGDLSHPETNVILQRTVSQLCSIITDCFSRVLQEIVEVFKAVDGRKHPSSLQSRQLKLIVSVVRLIETVLSSSLLVDRICFDASFWQSLAGYLAFSLSVVKQETNLSPAIGQKGSSQLVETGINAMRLICTNPSLVVEHCLAIFDQSFPILMGFLRLDGAVEWVVAALQIVSELFYVTVPSILDDDQNGDNQDRRHLVVSRFTELFTVLDKILNEKEPAPALILRCLCLFIDEPQVLASAVVERNCLPVIMGVWANFQKVKPPQCDTILMLVELIGCLVSTCAFQGDQTTEIEKQTKNKLSIIDFYREELVILLKTGFDQFELDSGQRYDGHALIPYLSLLELGLNHVSAVVKEILHNRNSQAQYMGSTLDAHAAEQLLVQNQPLNSVVPGLLTLASHEDADVRQLAVTTSAGLVQLYGPTEKAVPLTPYGLGRLAEALGTNGLLEIKQQKLLMKALKRLFKAQLDGGVGFQSEGYDVLLDVFKGMERLASSQADFALNKLAAELVAILS